jgi:hypothetical protein
MTPGIFYNNILLLLESCHRESRFPFWSVGKNYFAKNSIDWTFLCNNHLLEKAMLIGAIEIGKQPVHKNPEEG